MMEGENDHDDDPDGGPGGMTDKKTDEPITVGIPQEKQVSLPFIEEEDTLTEVKTETTYMEPPQDISSSVRLRPLQQGVLLTVTDGQEDNVQLNGNDNSNKEEGIEITDNLNAGGAV